MCFQKYPDEALDVNFCSVKSLLIYRGGLASRANGLGPEGPPQQGFPWAPSMLEEKYFKWLIFDELYDSDKTTSFNQRKIGSKAL